MIPSMSANSRAALFGAAVALLLLGCTTPAATRTPATLPAAQPAPAAQAPATPVAPTTSALPERLSDAAFWKLESDISEPGGYFRIEDNYTSNEMEIG